MSSPLRTGLRVARNGPLLVTAGAAMLLRAAVAAFYPLLAVVFPPIFAATLLGAVAPAVREAVDDPDADPEWRIGPPPRNSINWSLPVAAVVGHAVALALGAAAFLVVDTAVRAAIYAFGGTIPATAVLVAPLTGVAVGSFLAWALVLPGIARLAAGASPRDAARAAVSALRDRRRTAMAFALHGVVAAVGAAVFVTGVATDGLLGPRSTAFLLTVGAGGALAVLFPFHVALDRGRGVPPVPSVGTLPLGRVALAALVVSGLVVGASAVRLTETRPTPAVDDGPLPENATAAYAEAADRTNTADHRVVVERDGATHAGEYVLVRDRDDRRYLASSPASLSYGDAGVGAPSFASPYALDVRRIADWPGSGNAYTEIRAVPGYWALYYGQYHVAQNAPWGLPHPNTGEWETVARENGTLTIELTGEPALEALGESTAESADDARIRIRVDVESGVVRGGHAQIRENGGDSDASLRYGVETGDAATVERPESIGPRTPAEWVWKLFAY